METSRFLLIEDIWVPTALLTERFVCDLDVCKGLCCVIGESGAPLEPQEVELLEREYDAFEPFMTEQGQEAVARRGVAVVDRDGEWETPLVGDDGECAYAWFDRGGICRCAIETAFFESKTPFRKPISCWLYPIRIQKLSTGCALNYHQWHLCAGACTCGIRQGVAVFRFLKEPIVARFGEAFYKGLEESASMMG